MTVKTTHWVSLLLNFVYVLEYNLLTSFPFCDGGVSKDFGALYI